MKRILLAPLTLRRPGPHRNPPPPVRPPCRCRERLVVSATLAEFVMVVGEWPDPDLLDPGLPVLTLAEAVRWRLSPCRCDKSQRKDRRAR